MARLVHLDRGQRVKAPMRAEYGEAGIATSDGCDPLSLFARVYRETSQDFEHVASSIPARSSAHGGLYPGKVGTRDRGPREEEGCS